MPMGRGRERLSRFHDEGERTTITQAEDVLKLNYVLGRKGENPGLPDREGDEVVIGRLIRVPPSVRVTYSRQAGARIYIA